MYLRKLQLIAGTTYSISLPKAWVLQHKLRPQSTLALQETNDRSLLLSPNAVAQAKLEKFEVDVDQYRDSVDQILFGLFYAGCTDITLSAAKQMSPEARAAIKRTVTYMSGTEIIYEDDQQIKLKVLLETAHLDIHQLFFRVVILISSSLAALQSQDAEILQLNEHEIDRLYHLIVKVISISQLNSGVLKESGINSSVNILHYFLIAKRLEHLGDNLFRLQAHLKPQMVKGITPLLQTVERLLKRSINTLMGKHRGVYQKTEYKRVLELMEETQQIKNDRVRRYVAEALRCAVDIEEELVNTTFYHELQQQGVLQ